MCVYSICTYVEYYIVMTRRAVDQDRRSIGLDKGHGSLNALLVSIHSDMQPSESDI